MDNKKELTWICGLLPQDDNQRIVSLCKKANQDIGLPENVFALPLHISMKKSFLADDFLLVKQEMKRFALSKGSIPIKTNPPILHKNMIWLPIEPSIMISSWHHELDALLLDKFGIEIANFDKAFKPHISLFTKGTAEKMKQIYPALQKALPPMEMEIKRFVIGSSAHKDEFFDV